jgi:Cytochrome c oxidase biogenesis protein Cmc1 like
MPPQTAAEQYTEQVQKLYGGPLGLGKINSKTLVNFIINGKIKKYFFLKLNNLKGDPKDRSLRKVEKEVLVPQIMRDRGKVEKCVAEVKDFEACCKKSSLLMIVKCRNENSMLKNCLAGWYKNQ